MQLFDSAKMYVFLFCVLALITVEKLHQLTQIATHSDTGGVGIERLLVAPITFFMAVYLPILLRKISNRIEQVGIVLTEALCVLWLADLLASFGVALAAVPHSRLLNLGIHCAITLMAAVRVFQVLRHPNRPMRHSET